MNLTLQERETVILFNEADPTASVYTHNAALRRRLAALATERPTECTAVRFNEEDGAAEYTIPKKWVKIKPSRILSEAQKAASKLAINKALLSRNITPPAVK